MSSAANPASLNERCRSLGIERHAIYNRLRLGMTIDQAFASATGSADAKQPYMIERREIAALMRRWRRGGPAR